MRHGKKFNHLGRKTAHRKAMLSNMACSLIEHKSINTTLAKAKALRVYVEPLLTKSKADSTHSRRIVFSYLQSKDAVTELFREVAPKIANRPGGYTRIIRTGYRLGDNAEMCMIELVDFNEIYSNEGAKKTTTRRSRRGGGGAAKVEATDTTETTEVASEDTAPEAKAEAVVEEKVEAEVKEETTPVEEPEAVVEKVVEKTPVVEAEEAVEETVEETPAAEEESTPADEADAPEAKADDADEKDKEEK